MFSSPTPAPGSRALAANALRSAGLIDRDRDATMRDATDKPGGRKGSSKIRSHRIRPIDAFKDSAGPSHRLPTRISTSTSHAGPSDPLSIRGAARPTAAGRIRRNAFSANSPSGIPVRISSSSTKSKQTIEHWRELVRKRWNPKERFLNLELMIEDEVVKKYNLTPPGSGNGSARDAAVIFKIAGELKPEVQTLSLAGNNITGAHLTSLSKYLPRLANLSLQKNNICAWKDLDYISARRDKLVHLRELILLDNPIRDLEFKNGRGDRYKSELCRRFTSLEVLDQEAITQISFDVPQPSVSQADVIKPTSTTFPCEMGPSFVTGVDGSIVSTFLIRFFNMFDNHRGALIDAYDPLATFSFSANTAIPIRARIEGFHSSRDMPNQRKLEWGPWLTGGAGGSRNLSRITGGLEKAVESLHIGGEATVKALVNLPKTRHDIGGPPEKFCLDSFPVAHGQGMGLLLTLHGQFTEAGTEGIRSFDRTFILAPAVEGSRAKLNGWDVVILSDQWIIRGYSSHEAWKPGPMLVQAASKHSSTINAVTATAPAIYELESLPVDQQTTLALMPEMQRNLVLQTIARTGLNVKFSVDCLTGNGWDLERAVANFNQVKGTLARDAFL